MNAENENCELPSFVKIAIDQVAQLNKFPPNAEKKIRKGSSSVDGYSSKTIGFTITENSKSVDCFLKYFPIALAANHPLVTVYRNEIYFYNKIMPSFSKFEINCGVSDGFNNVPKYYHTETMNCIAPIVLEDLRPKGYILRNPKEDIDEAHVALVLKTFAKFHAISFAMKDQQTKLFESLCYPMIDILIKHMVDFSIDKAISSSVSQFISDLDPVKDKRLVDHSEGLGERLVSFYKNTDKLSDDYSVITHADSWSNNLMFLHNADTGVVEDVQIIDWQVIRMNSPVLDVVYFFYTASTKEIMNDFEKYKKIYYDALSNHIKALGSDPNTCYPFEIFEKHWKIFGIFGFVMSFLAIKAMLCEEDEVPDMLEDAKNGDMTIGSVVTEIRNKYEYNRRIKDIFTHFLDNDLF